MAEIIYPPMIPVTRQSLTLLEAVDTNQARSGLRTLYHRPPIWRMRLEIPAFPKSIRPQWPTIEAWVHGMSSGRHWCRIPLQHARDAKQTGRPTMAAIPTGTPTLTASPASLNLARAGAIPSAATTYPTGVVSQARVGSRTYSLVRTAGASQDCLLYRDGARLGTLTYPAIALVNWRGGLYIVTPTVGTNRVDLTMQRVLTPTGVLDPDSIQYFRVAATPAAVQTARTALVQGDILYLAGTAIWALSLPGGMVSTSPRTAATQSHGGTGVVSTLLVGPPDWRLVQNYTHVRDGITASARAIALPASVSPALSGYSEQGFFWLMDNTGQQHQAVWAGPGDVIQVIPLDNQVKLRMPPDRPERATGGSLCQIGDRIFMLQSDMSETGGVSTIHVLPNPGLLVQPGDHLTEATHMTCVVENPGTGFGLEFGPSTVGPLTMDLIERVV